MPRSKNVAGIIKTIPTVLKNAMDNLTPATKKDTIGTVVLADEYPNEIEKSIANFRFIYYNDLTIQGLIDNNAMTANTKFEIKIKKGYEDVKNIEEARSYIENRCKKKDWNLDKIITQTLIKAQRDGQCFIQVPIVGGQAHLNPLTYDGENYDFMMIPDPETGKVSGYVQKHPEKPDFTGWDKKEWDDLVKISEEVGDETTTSFIEEEIIHFTIMEEDGEAKRLMDAICDKVPDKWDYEGFMISIAQKTGAVAIVKIGDVNHNNNEARKSFVDTILGVFQGRINKTAVAVPDGVSVEQMTNSTLPDIPSYRKTVIDELYLGLQTPFGMFDTQNSTYASLKEAMNSKTGYGAWMAHLRDLVKEAFEDKLIDKDLSLKSEYAECVGGLEINYEQDLDEVEPLEPTDEDYSANNEGLEQAANNQNENNEGEVIDE